jgi:L-aspartate oxidase
MAEHTDNTDSTASDPASTDRTEVDPVESNPRETTETDVLVLGSGIAGCAAALRAAREGSEVLLATKATRPEQSTSWWAQGGIAVSRSDPEAFGEDVLAAGDGAGDPEAVDVLVENADDAVEDVLIDTLGIPFDVEDSNDRDDDAGRLDYGREAAHSERRILHVNASTGRHVLGPFLSYLDDHPNVTIREDTAGLDLLTHEGRVHGAICESDGRNEAVYAGATVLATGGIGSLYSRSTNPGGTGDGVAMAVLAGANVADMEYVQFHPTAFAGEGGNDTDGGDTETAGTFLLSEAVRGEGALLHNGENERFMPEYHAEAELAPRDVVARAVAAERERTGDVFLDVASEAARERALELNGEELDFETEFPDLAAECRKRGVDPAEGIPVAPAEHFLCGGIAVDSEGRTSLDRLFAVGECSRTGVHGANRLASTSLLEGLVWGLRAGRAASGYAPETVEAPDLADSDPALPATFSGEKLARLGRVMDEHCGLVRSPAELNRATAAIRRLKGEVDAYTRTRTSRSLYELRNAVVAGLLVARAAAANPQSRGCHYLASDTATDGADGDSTDGSETGSSAETETDRETETHADD